MEDDILTIEEVAKYLRVSDRTVYDWAQKGEIPAGKIGAFVDMLISYFFLIIGQPKFPASATASSPHTARTPASGR